MMKTTTLLIVAAAALCSLLVDASPRRSLSDSDPTERIMQDALLSTIKLIRKYGYPAEEHTVTTDDGYILEMHRIPYSAKSPEAQGKPVVLLQHGLLCSSADWVIMGTEKGLAYILADLGYDVWMGNSRGNTYSRAHTTLDPDSENGTFWNFSWHEMGWYDITAEIDYILSNTRQEKLFYIGHSQGTTQFYVMASERPEYNDKIRAMFSLAPVAYMHNAPSPFLQIIANSNDTTALENLFGVHEFLPHSDALAILGDQLCRDTAITQVICENILFLIAGYDSEQLNSTTLPVIIGHTPAGASTKQLVHYAQEIQSASFRQFDYHEANMDMYGSEHPPNYDLSKITCPVALHYSSNDLLASTIDVESLHAELGNSIGLFHVPLPQFNHLDYLWAIDVKTLLYDLVTEQMSQY